MNDSTEELDIYDRDTDCFEGVQSLHFYSGSSNVDFSAGTDGERTGGRHLQTDGTIQGDAGRDKNATVYFYAVVNGEETKWTEN